LWHQFNNELRRCVDTGRFFPRVDRFSHLEQRAVFQWHFVVDLEIEMDTNGCDHSITFSTATFEVVIVDLTLYSLFEALRTKTLTKYGGTLLGPSQPALETQFCGRSQSGLGRNLS
jgi:hypothetical protein